MSLNSKCCDGGTPWAPPFFVFEDYALDSDTILEGVAEIAWVRYPEM
jgi:hypothetical protein